MPTIDEDMKTLRERDDYQAMPLAKRQAWEDNMRAEHGAGSVIPEVAALGEIRPRGAGAIHPALNPESWRTLGRVGQQAALPVGGAVLAGPLGGLLGETINQAAGITPPSTEAQVLSGIVPGAGNLTARAINVAPRAFGRAIPGSAVAAHELARQQIVGGVERIIPTVKQDVESAYGVLAPFEHVPIKTPKLLKTLRAMETEQAEALPLARSEGIRGPISESIAEVTKGGSPEMSFGRARQNIKLLGAKTEGLKGPELGAYKSAFKALNEDLEAMAGKAGVPDDMVSALKSATRTAKEVFAKDDMKEILVKNMPEVTTQIGAGTAVQVNAAKMLNDFRKQMRTDKNFAAVWQPHAKEVEGWFQDIAKLPRIPPPPSQPIGSGREIAKLALGGYAGSLTGMPGAELAGAYLGLKAPQWIAEMMLTPQGRRVSKYLLTRSGGYLDPTVTAGLAAYVGSGTRTLSMQQ